MFFTDEEKSQYKINLLKAYEPFKLVQRYIVLFTIPRVRMASSQFADPRCVRLSGAGSGGTVFNQCFFGKKQS